MATTSQRYTLEEINQILFNGFDYSLNEDTIKVISEIALQVGSPEYVKTRVFQKREVINTQKTCGDEKPRFNKKYRTPNEMVNDEDWDAIRAVQITQQTKEKSDTENHIDSIRINLNKLTNKNYIDMRNKIFEIIDKLNPEDIPKISTIIFEIASTNRFYSKLYADLYSDLSTKYTYMMDIIKENIDKFTDLFEKIEYVDPNANYDKFCEVNKSNEKRKSLAVFYMNLMENGIIKKEVILNIMISLITQFYNFLREENKKNEVDELTEIIALLYNKELYEKEISLKIDNYTVVQLVEQIAKSKVKDYKSLTNKSLFKFMDLVEATNK